MKKRLLTYSTLFGTGFLLACATPPPMSSLVVKPVMNVSSPSERSDGYYQLGRYYQGQNRLDQAIEAYRKALALDRNFVDAHNALGAAYAEQGRLDEAVIEFKLVVAALPEASYAWNNLGYAYVLLRNSTAAIAALERAVAFDRTNQRAWNNLGMALVQHGDFAAANEKFARAVQLAATPAPSAPSAVAIASAAAVPAVAAATAPAASPAEVPVATLDVTVVEATARPGAGDRVVLDRPKEASVPIQPQPQSAAAGESVKAPAPLLWAVVDSTGTHELVQLAPNILELRLARVFTAAVQSFRLELSNGNGFTGMAKRLGEQLAASGLPEALLTSQKPFSQQTTEIQYRDGYADAASSLRRRMPNQPLVIKTAVLRADTDVRMVLGEDLPSDVAVFDGSPGLMTADAARDALWGTHSKDLPSDVAVSNGSPGLMTADAARDALWGTHSKDLPSDVAVSNGSPGLMTADAARGTLWGTHSKDLPSDVAVSNGSPGLMTADAARGMLRGTH